MRKFAVYIEWNYCGAPEERYENCIIAPATPEDEEHAGENYISRCGAEGMDFDVYDSLHEAILAASYNPFAATYEGLTEDEIKTKNELLAKYTWSPEVELLEKGA